MDEMSREEVIAAATRGALATWTRDIIGNEWHDDHPLDRWRLTVTPHMSGWRYTIRAAKVFGPPREGFARTRLAAIQAARVDWVELMVEAITNIVFPNP